jgi:hypothetical protein
MSDESVPVAQSFSSPVEGLTAEAPAVEVPKVEVPKQEDFLAPKFAALTRKEKEVRAREAALKARETEASKRWAEIESKSKSVAETEAGLLAEMKRNPLKFMEKHGLSFDQMTEMQLNEQNPTPQMMIERMKAELDEKYSKELAELKGSLTAKEKAAQDQAVERAVSEYKASISTFIKENAETYELVANNDATDLMFETAENFYQQTGQVPDLSKLAAAVEEHLEEQAREIFKLKKFQTAQPKATAPKTAQTLSNTLAAEVPKSGTKLMSDEQSKREAAKLIRWE